MKVVEAATPATEAWPAADEAEGPYAWFELAARAPSPLVTVRRGPEDQRCSGCVPDDTMLAGDEGSRQWQVEDARARQEQRGPASGPGHAGRRPCGCAWRPWAAPIAAASLAVLIDGRVVCLPKIQEKMGPQIEIDGAFDARQADRLLRRLLCRRPAKAKTQIRRRRKRTTRLLRGRAVVRFDGVGVRRRRRNRG